MGRSRRMHDKIGQSARFDGVGFQALCLKIRPFEKKLTFTRRGKTCPVVGFIVPSVEYAGAVNLP